MGIPAPANTAEAVDMVLTGLSYLAVGDPTALAARAQAECLHAFEQADAISTAARARILAAFTAGQGYSADADYGPTGWLIHRTRINQGRGPRPPGLGSPRGRTRAGGGGAGRRNRAVGVRGPADLPMDR